MRSVAAYTFSEAYRELDAYLKIANYTDAKDYMVGPSHYDEDLAGLIALLTRKSKGGRASEDFIAHYRQNYDEVPLWVLVKDLTFGNVSYFYGLQKRSVQNLICKRVVMPSTPRRSAPSSPSSRPLSGATPPRSKGWARCSTTLTSVFRDRKTTSESQFAPWPKGRASFLRRVCGPEGRCRL